MSATIPTIDGLKAVFPEFQDLPLPLLEHFFCLAEDSVPKNCFGKLYAHAFYLYMAHYLFQTSAFAQAAKVSGSVAGSVMRSEQSITKKKVGDVEISYSPATKKEGSNDSQSELNSTNYGRQYLDLLKRKKGFAGFVAAPMVDCGCPTYK